MKTPQKVSVEDFSRARMDWIREHCHDEAGLQICNHCQSRIHLLSAYISIHDARFGDSCAGAGTVFRIAIPYCPQCEKVPDEQGCFHINSPLQGAEKANFN